MNLRAFHVFLLFWSFVLAQNEFEQGHNVEAFENNAAFGPDETEENPTYVVENILVTDSMEIPEDAVENDVELTQTEHDQHLVEDVSEFIVDNGKYPVGANTINEETAGNNIDSNQEVKNYPSDIITEDVTNDKRDIGVDSSNIQEQNEFVQNHDAYNVENGGRADGPAEENPVEYEINGKRYIDETDTTDVSVHDQLDQKYNAEGAENNGHIIEVVPRYEVDHNVNDARIDPAEVENQEDNAYSINKNDQESEQDPAVEVGIDESAVGEDAMEILGLPEFITSQNLRLTIRYSIAGPRIFVVDIFTVGVDHADTIYHTEWTEVSYYPGKAKEKIVRITLPDNLVFKEDRILHISPDLHSESLLFRTAIVDYKNPSVVMLFEEQPLVLIPPWSRLPKSNKRYCNSWIGTFYKKLHENRIPTCPKIDDVVELLSYPVALVGSEHGYKKLFQTLHEPEEMQNNLPQFTLATWLYLTKPCAKDMCPLMYHIKGTAYQSPLVGLLKTGHIHLQFHYEDRSGFAFLVDAEISAHKWFHITVTVKYTVVTVYVRYGKNLEHVKLFVHSDFPAEPYHYNDTDGYWGLGGSPGFISTHGFIGPARIYRRHVLSKEAIETIFNAASRPHLGITDHFKSCRKLRNAVRILLKEESKAKNLCPATVWLPHSPRLFCKAGARGLANEIVQTLINTLELNETTGSNKIQDEVYNHAFYLTKAEKNNVRDALLLLSYTSCLRHPKSLYLLSVLRRTGLGVSVNTRVSQRSLLLGAYYNHPLSQMSLAYKHYIGVDSFPKDHEVASTYYRYAAVQSNRVLVEHNEVDTHSEALRLDKKEDLDHYRGPNSNWFSWLKHQAKRGVTDAQSALGEVFYYGSRGFRRNLTKAAEFYEMGANRGDAQMLFNLGVVKLRGQGVDVNQDEAQDLLKKSAELGFAPAYNALGYYELNVRQNKSGAFEYFRYAAEHEDRDGLYNLGFSLENGLAPGTVGDLKSAMPYYISAANKGHTGACLVAGDAFSVGQHVDRDIRVSIIFYKFVADQNPEIGLLLRNGLDGFFENAWYQSLLHYLLAAEAGMEIAQYNTALLCEWDWERVSQSTQVDCAWRYYNHSAKQEWVPSLIKSGDNHWYGITAEKNITAAAQLYSRAAVKDENPQAIYNLGYLVENNYPLDELAWMHFYPSIVNPGNLTLAAILYRKCRDSSDEALVPCSLGLARVAIKMAWQPGLVSCEIFVIPLALITFFTSFALLYYLCCLPNYDRQMVDLA